MLTKIQKQVLEGAMLGDGNLSCRNKNAELRYTSSIENHIKLITNYFLNYTTPHSFSVKTLIHPKTNNSYTSYRLRTRQHEDFTKEYYRWYGTNNHKEIPRDLILTSLSCLIWYIGDGTLSHSKRRGQELKLCTNNFSKEKLEKIIIPQLKVFEARTRLVNEHQYHIIISHKNIKNFLSFIGNCPIKEYEYKWNFEEYKNNMSFRNYGQYEKEIISLYKTGLTYYKVAKYFNMDPSLIRYYLKKNGIIK